MLKENGIIDCKRLSTAKCRSQERIVETVSEFLDSVNQL